MATAIALTLGGNTNYLTVTGFNFSIPPTATINGITVQIQKKASGLLQTVHDESVMIIKNGAMAGTDHALSGIWPTSATYFSYGSTSDLWGNSWTPDDINVATFGVAISASLAGLSVLPTAYIDQVIISVCYTPAPLPIELLDFEGTRQNNDLVNLNWTTLTETNNNYFTIECSPDGIAWKEKGKIAGARFSTTKQAYTFTDTNNLNQTSYYRLKQTDYNGQSTCFKIITVSPAESTESISAYPNPAKNLVNIHSQNNIASIQIINSKGVIIDNIQYNNDANTKDVQIALPEEEKMYLIHVIDCYGKIQSDKIFITK